MHHSPTCNKIMGVVRILLGVVMLYMGVTKLLDPAGMQEFIGGAAHELGLTFFSLGVWFRIATVAELLAGWFLVTGHWYRIWAVLTLIVMAFAINYAGLGRLPITVTLASVAVLIWGAGSWRLCHGSCCRWDDDGCCGKCKWAKDGNCTCSHEHHHHMHHQQQ